jgi:hypothetical protein
MTGSQWINPLGGFYSIELDLNKAVKSSFQVGFVFFFLKKKTFHLHHVFQWDPEKRK